MRVSAYNTYMFFLRDNSFSRNFNLIKINKLNNEESLCQVA